jgi:hypothetical protein
LFSEVETEVVTETVVIEATVPAEDEAARSEGSEAAEADEKESVTELAVQLGRDVSVLALCEAQLAASRNMPEVRRAARDLVGALIAVAALLTAFVFANVAAFEGLSIALSGWEAALVLGAAWLVLGLVVLVAVMVRAGHATGWKWWRVFSAGPEEATKDLERARDEAKQAVRETLERLAPAVTVEIATAAVPMAGDIAGDMVDAGQDILEGSDDIVEAIAEDLPGGGVVAQVWDVVLMPGRFGLKVATTVMKRGEPES